MRMNFLRGWQDGHTFLWFVISIFTFIFQHVSKTYASRSLKVVAGLVAQSVMSATDTLGYRDVRGLSATDPCPRQ